MPVNNIPIPPDRLLLFDGVCNLCDRSVQFIIRHDPDAKFKFAALQSDYALRVLDAYGNLPAGSEGSIILILLGKVYIRSTAVIKIACELGYPWRAAGILYILPRRIRDAVYNYIARRRYRWYGQKETCLVPTPDIRARFID